VICRRCRCAAQRDKLFLCGTRGDHIAKSGLAAHQKLQSLLILGPRGHHLAQPLDQRKMLLAYPIGRGECGGKARLGLGLREAFGACGLGGGDALRHRQVGISRRAHLPI